MKILKPHFILLILLLVLIRINCIQEEFSANVNRFIVKFSSVQTPIFDLYKLDSARAWSSLISDQNQWIQAGPQSVQNVNNYKWVTIITQGRADSDQWVTKYKVSYSEFGRIWNWVDDGREFTANQDRNTKKRNNFNRPVWGRFIRIHPTAWYGHISLRFDAILALNIEDLI